MVTYWGCCRRDARLICEGGDAYNTAAKADPSPAPRRRCHTRVSEMGPRAGGLLMGLLLTTGPIFLFLAIDQGPHFPAGAAVGILFGLVGLAAFAWRTRLLPSRTGWVASLAFATAAFFASSEGARLLGSDVVIAGLAAWLAQVFAVSLISRPERWNARPAPPWWDLWVRCSQ